MKKEEIDWGALQSPFEPRWRIQSTKSGKAICIPYIDARQVQERLDDVLGPSNWQNNFDNSTGLATIGILIDNDWVFKSDVGTETHVEAIKGRASDAFKRAAVLWGIGRHLYSISTRALETDGKNALTAKGETIWTGEQLTNYLNGVTQNRGLLNSLWKQNPGLHKNDEFLSAMGKLKELAV